uniref:HMG box domain-containing protein n=1 Tax=Glossina austeni TaxID=7395 RepID=A0A1A9VHV4_GLOAU
MAENNRRFQFGRDMKGGTLPQFRCQQEEIYGRSAPGTSFLVFVLTLSCNQLRRAVRKATKKWQAMSDLEKQTYTNWAQNNREETKIFIRRELCAICGGIRSNVQILLYIVGIVETKSSKSSLADNMQLQGALNQMRIT